MFASVISSYKLAKVGFDKISQFRHAPDVMKQTCDLCATLLEPMMVAEALATRHASLRIVGPALRFAHTTVSQCNQFTSELGVGVVMGEGDEGDDGEGGESSSGWAAYLISRTGGATKLEQLGEMLTQLARASTALQLALAAVLASLPPRFAYSPFRYVREAVEAARSGYLQLEMGRQRSIRLCAGELWQRGIALSGRGGKRRADVMARLYDCTVSLTNDAEGEKSGDSEGDEGEETAEEARPDASESAQDVLFLRFLPQSDDESSGGEQMTVPVDETVRLRRYWASELSQVMELKQSEEFVEIVGEVSYPIFVDLHLNLPPRLHTSSCFSFLVLLSLACTCTRSVSPPCSPSTFL